MIESGRCGISRLVLSLSGTFTLNISIQSLFTDLADMHIKFSYELLKWEGQYVCSQILQRPYNWVGAHDQAECSPSVWFDKKWQRPWSGPGLIPADTLLC